VDSAYPILARNVFNKLVFNEFQICDGLTINPLFSTVLASQLLSTLAAPCCNSCA
jgi:hypothetical protein